MISPGDEFKGKYIDENFITKYLINNFFHNICLITKDRKFNRVLEVGCGHGYSTKYIQRIFKDKHVEASDYSSELIIDAKEMNPQISITQESIYDLKRADNSFDLVISLEVLEHLKEPERGLRELLRVTSKYCLISVPREPLWRFLNITRGAYLKNFGNTPGHINHWSATSFTEFVKKYFKVVDVKLPIPWIMIFLEK